MYTPRPYSYELTAIYRMRLDDEGSWKTSADWRLLHCLTARGSSLWLTSVSRLNKSILQIEQHRVYSRDRLCGMYSICARNTKTYCTYTDIHTQTHSHTQAVAVVDGRPQGVGRQPVSQNEAQSNHSEMNTLEDSQTTTSNTQTHTESERRGTLNPNSC